MIIEEITKKTYEENLRERIFEPLGMKNSGIDKPSVLLKNYAEDYEYGFEGFENSGFINMDPITFSAGAIYSTVEDLNLWETALFSDKFLSKENKKLLRVAMIEKMRLGVSCAELVSLYTKVKIEGKNNYNLSGSEAFLNNLGYYLLGKNRIKDSLAILKLAVKEHPESANTFDTYAEALMKDGQKEAAIKN